MNTNPPLAGHVPSHALTSAALEVAAPHWQETLSDGTHVLIRLIRKSDAEIERAFIEHLSPESRRFRFLGQVQTPSEELIRRFTDIDYEHDVALVALVHRDGRKEEVGVARYAVTRDHSCCECAVAVADAWQHRGLATVLMTHLMTIARDRGMREMVSMDLAENHAMRDLALGLGFTREADPDDPAMVIHRRRL